MIVKLRQEFEEYQDLTYGQFYVLIGIEADDFRLLNDQGRPYLYPAHLFDIVDDRKPSEWVKETGEDGEIYAYPPKLNESGFFEDFFDGKKGAVTTFWRVVNQWLSFSKVPGLEMEKRAGAPI
jgi:hypothetical protein